MMNRFMFVALAGVVMAVASGCGKQCQEARQEILQPTQKVMTYLETNPDGQALSTLGCFTILSDLEQIPHGAKVIRDIAASRFTDSYATCDLWETSTRYRCGYPTEIMSHRDHDHDRDDRPGRYYPPYPGYPYPSRCYPETYQYCARWSDHETHQPGYDSAVKFSSSLDLMYERAQKMCGKATSGDFDGAYKDSRDLLKYMQTEVKPEGDTVYALACGK